MITRFALADLVIDLEEGSVTRAGERVQLTDLSFRLLAKLAENAPHPVDSAGLAVGVWGTPHVSDETVAQRVKLLRRALDDDPKAPRYIRTVRGAGYASVQPVPFDRSRRAQLRVSGKIASIFGVVTVVAGVSLTLYSWLWTALDTGEQAEFAPPSIVGALVERAQAQLQVQQAEETDRAIELLRHASALESDNPGVHVALSFALSTRMTKFRGRDDDSREAEELARRALISSPGMGSAWHALGYALDAQGRVDEALGSYLRAIELDSTDVAAMSSAAYLLSVRGRLFEALVLETRAMEKGRYSRYAETQIAWVLELIGHPGAVRWRSRARALNPSQTVVVAEAAESLLRRGKPADALEVLEQASGLDRESPRLHRLRGRAALLAGDFSRARTAFMQAGDCATLDLAALESLSGSVAPAEAPLTAAREEMVAGNSWPGLRVQAAELYASLGDDETALGLLSQAVDLGWRDAAAVEQSPFLTKTVGTEAWATIRHRIERELAVQRTLIEGAPRLARIVEKG